MAMARNMTRLPIWQSQRRTRTFLAALLILSLAGCASYSGGPETSASTSAGSAVGTRLAKFEQGVGTRLSQTAYRIGAPDVLTIKVFQVEDLDREVTVNADGSISFPLIGKVMAAGRTTQELEKAIATRLGAKYLQSPQVAVSVKDYASQKFTVDGAVKAPGVYPLTGDLTLLQALATAKGLTDVARSGNVVIFRQIEGRRAVARFDVSMIRSGQLKDPQIRSGDVVVVDESGFKTTLREVARVAPVIGLFRFF